MSNRNILFPDPLEQIKPEMGYFPRKVSYDYEDYENEKAQENFYELVITSDHGNVEYLKDENGNLVKGHSDSKVPFVICNEKYKLKSSGTLADVVPTIIDIYEISKPKEMTGESLIEK